MNGLHYIWRNIRHRSLLSALTVFAVMVTAALFVLLLMCKDGFDEGAKKGYGPFELVIGAEGSEIQLVLHTFYRVGVPTGNIPHELLEHVRASEEVEYAFGLTAGDNYRGYPIVGIDPAYFQARYGDRQLAEGRLYSQLGEVTVGYAVARSLGLEVGDQFHGAHGVVHHGNGQDEGHEEHEAFMYTVTGILPKLNTADDRTIFTTMDHAWAVHEQEEAQREITAVLVKPASLFGLQKLKQDYDQWDHVQAAYSSRAVADVLNRIDTGSQLILIVMVICVLLAAVTLMLAMTASIQERKRDVGLLRLIGKPKSYILLMMAGEGVLLAVMGLVLGLILGHLIGWAIGDLVFVHTGVQLQPGKPATGEFGLMVAAVGIGVLASLGPAIRIYRTDALSLFRP